MQRRRLIGGKNSTVVREGSDGGREAYEGGSEKDKRAEIHTYVRTCKHTQTHYILM